MSNCFAFFLERFHLFAFGVVFFHNLGERFFYLILSTDMSCRIVLIDNYDSFTYNLVQYVQELGAEVVVKRNDEVDTGNVVDLDPDGIIFSPGPGTVEDENCIGAGVGILEEFVGKIPLLGVCLGHQMIAHYFGGKIYGVDPVHGKRSRIGIVGHEGLFRGMPDEIEVMRYHSLAVSGDNFPSELKITALSDEGIVMAFENIEMGVFGVQFHPESIGTPGGKEILGNFLRYV